MLNEERRKPPKLMMEVTKRQEDEWNVKRKFMNREIINQGGEIQKVQIHYVVKFIDWAEKKRVLIADQRTPA